MWAAEAAPASGSGKTGMGGFAAARGRPGLAGRTGYSGVAFAYLALARCARTATRVACVRGNICSPSPARRVAWLPSTLLRRFRSVDKKLLLWVQCCCGLVVPRG
jgi:hypothetical protein